jgi:hypothetical protein
MMFSLQKTLVKTAHTILRVERDLKLNDRHAVDALGKKFGAATIEKDFERWCLDVKKSGTRAPTFSISEYLKIAESRMEKKHHKSTDN